MKSERKGYIEVDYRDMELEVAEAFDRRSFSFVADQEMATTPSASSM